jgi:hypothetical protein
MAIRALDCCFEGSDVVGREAKECLRQDDGHSGVHRVANETNKKAIEQRRIAHVNRKESELVRHVDLVAFGVGDQGNSNRSASGEASECIATLIGGASWSAIPEVVGQHVVVGCKVFPLGSIAKQERAQRQRGWNCSGHVADSMGAVKIGPSRRGCWRCVQGLQCRTEKRRPSWMLEMRPRGSRAG